MAITDELEVFGAPNSLNDQSGDTNLLNSAGLSCEITREKSNYGRMNLQQGCDVLKSDSEMELVPEIDIAMEWGTDGCSTQEQKTEKIAVGVDELRVASSQKTPNYERPSHSRTLGIKRSKIYQSSSTSSSGSSRSSSTCSSGSFRSSSASSSGSSRSSSTSSSGSFRSGSTSSSGSSRSSSVSSSASSRSGSISSGSSRSSSVSSSSSSPIEVYRSTSDGTSLASRGRCVSRGRSYRRSRSRSRSCSRSCYPRSRYQMSWSPHRYRSRSRWCIPYSRPYRRPRSSLRYRRSHSGSRSRSPSRLQKNNYGSVYKAQLPSHRKSRSRSSDRSIHLTQKEKKKLLEIATANADKLLGKSNVHLPPNLRPASSLSDECFCLEKCNSNAVKELTRREVLNIRSLPKKRSTVFEDKFIGFYSLEYTVSMQLHTFVVAFNT
uniref:arginine/serine-rich protein 1 isoform X2 n=1 Tax=Pristiophorus japonicus TaxID=55135 RepID=UPI00398E8A6A